MAVKSIPEEPLIPLRLQRPLAAVWISLGLHAALLGLVQVAPQGSLGTGELLIEARLVPAHAASPVAEPPAPMPEPPREAVAPLAPSEAAEALPVAAQVVPPVPSAPPAGNPDPAPPAASPPGPAPALGIASPVDLTYYSARDLDVQPRALRDIVPDYPAEADRRRLSGKLRLQLKLEADGRVSDVEVVSADPSDVFDESAIAAFRAARFAPAQRNGRPVRARVLIEVVYDWEGRR